MHIGISGPIYIPSLTINFDGDKTSWPIGMGGSPVNHEINALIEAGYKISIFSLSPEIEPGESFEWHGEKLSIYMGPYRKRARHRCFDLFFKERTYLKLMILKAKPEVIHAHWQYEWAWAALSTKIPTLVTCHDAPFRILRVQTDIYRLCRLIMAIIVLRKAKYLTAVSPHTAKGLKAITKKNVKIIPNFEPDKTFSLYKVDKIIESAVKIAMINNGFFGLKNVIAGIEAFHEYKKTNSLVQLHLFGHGHGENEDAHNWCKEHGKTEGIFFIGEISFDTLMEELSNAHILLHTSKEESCPMVLIEAMAMGIPVLAGENSGGIPWILKDGGGILVDITNVKNITDGLIEVSKPLLYTQFSKDARIIALKRFSQKVVLEIYLEKLKKIASESSAYLKRN